MSNKCFTLVNVLLFLVLMAAISVNGQALKADYQFQGNLNSSVAGAPAMTNLTGGGANSFATDVIDGYSRQTLRFPLNSGLALSTAAGLIPNNAYTIVVLFRFDQVSGFRRIASFDNLTTDNGAYVQDGRLEFENTANSPFQADTYIQIVIVRDAAGNIRAYRDGTQRVSQNDGGTFQISGANVLSFFQDDVEFPGEASAGNVARIRLYDAPMTTAQVQALDRLQVASASPNAAITFVSNRDGDFEIYAMDADGSRQYRLTNSPGIDGYPDWSPNGSKITFYSSRDGNNEIYSMNADGSSQTRLTNDPGSDVEPVWSPDGNKIAFQSTRDGDSEIYVLDLTSGITSQITNNAFLDSRPSWSSSGQIAFQTDRDGDVEIFKMDENGANPVQLTFNTAGEGQPAWSRDGSKIAFWSQRDGPMTEIYTMNADGTNQVRLTNNLVEDAKPSWSSNGNQLTFGSRPVPLSQILTMNANGSNQVRITVNSASDQWPDWRPLAVTGANLALNRPTIQSSNYSQGGGDSSHAVDGNTNGAYFEGSVTSTNLDTQAWWQVDLQSIGSIDRINVWNRTDCCADRLTNFYVLVSDAPFVSNDLTVVLSQPGVTGFLTLGQGGRPTSINVNRTGRYVRVQLVGSNYLSLAEVEVFGFGGANCTPYPIVYGQSINGTLNSSSCIANGPSDLYTFEGTAGQQIAISMDAFAGGFQPTLKLLDPTGTMELASDSGTTNARIPAGSGFFPLPSNGTYTIVASSPLGTFGSYALSLSLQPTTACNYTVSPVATNVSPGGGTYFYDVLSGVDCPTVTAAVGANSGHIQIVTNSGGRVTFGVSANGGTADRIGTIVAAGQTHTVIQFGVSAPTNDFFAQAEVLPGMTGIVPGRNTNSTAEPNEPIHAGSPATRSVWYRWTAPAEGLYSFTTSGSDFDTVMAIYTGSGVGALTRIAENDDSTSFDATSKVNFRAVQGVEYYIAIDGRGGANGSIRLSYGRYSRLYRLYLQTFNGVPSPITPDTVTALRQDGMGAVIPGDFISLGVYEFDLPDDNSPYVVTIAGPNGITWLPSTYVIDNTSGRFNELMQGAPGGGQNQTSNPTNTIPRIFRGFIDGIGMPQLPSLSVSIATNGSPSAVPPRPCPNPIINPAGRVVYSCVVQPQSTSQIVPNAPQMAFQLPVLQLPVISVDTGPSSQDPYYVITASNAPTYNISGRVLANGQGLEGVPVDITSGSLTMRATSGTGGNYVAPNLAPGTYTVRAAQSGSIFQPETVILQSSGVVRDLVAQTCSYTFSGGGNFNAAGGPGQFQVTAVTSQACGWTAVRDGEWISILSGSSIGNGNVQFNVQPNNGLARQGAITVGEQSFTISQEAGCSFVVTPAGPLNFPSSGGSGSFTIAASNGACTQTPTSNDYCMVNLGPSTVGNEPVTFTISENRGVARSAVVNIGGQPFTVTQDAGPGTHRAKFDFDGDGRSNISVFRPDTGDWYVLNSNGSYNSEHFGQQGDIPVAADYDNDGKADLAVFRPANGVWYRINSTANEFIPFQFGQAGDIPAPADYDGDGKADIAVFRPSNGVWYIQQSTNGFIGVAFGQAGDKPVAADYDGDGKAEVAVFRPSEGTWYFLNLTTLVFNATQFGAAEDVPVPADYDGDGKADIGVYRPSDTYWYSRNSSTGSFSIHQFGSAGDKPVPGDYNGDASADIAVYRPSNGNWYVWSCTNNPLISVAQFGASTDVPIPYPIAP